jgi:thioredoxin-related protein
MLKKYASNVFNLENSIKMPNKKIIIIISLKNCPYTKYISLHLWYQNSHDCGTC